MAGPWIEDVERVPRDEVPCDEVALFEWLFDEAWSDVDDVWFDPTGGFTGPSGAGREGPSSGITPRPALDPWPIHAGTGRAIIEGLKASLWVAVGG